MKCPKCGFHSFDYLDSCKKCAAPLPGKPHSQGAVPPEPVVTPVAPKPRPRQPLRPTAAAPSPAPVKVKSTPEPAASAPVKPTDHAEPKLPTPNAAPRQAAQIKSARAELGRRIDRLHEMLMHPLLRIGAKKTTTPPQTAVAEQRTEEKPVDAVSQCRPAPPPRRTATATVITLDDANVDFNAPVSAANPRSTALPDSTLPPLPTSYNCAPHTARASLPSRSDKNDLPPLPRKSVLPSLITATIEEKKSPATAGDERKPTI